MDFSPDDARVVFSSKREGSRGFDIYVSDGTGGGGAERVTSFPGDETGPVFSPLRYAFYAVQTDSCTDSGASGRQLDGYEKVAFTRAQPDGGGEEVWFASIKPVREDDVKSGWRAPESLSEHGYHAQRLSAAGASCRAPQWSGDGLSLVWMCEETGGAAIYDGDARWDQSFAAALAAIGVTEGDGDGPGDARRCEDVPSSWSRDACLKGLTRRYVRHDGRRGAAPDPSLRHVAVSNNQIELVAETAAGAVHRRRDRVDAPFAALPLPESHALPRNIVWSPTGRQVAYDAELDGRRTIALADTALYLQEVKNLRDFPELWRARESALLQNNRFVARAGKEKEFYVLYEKLRYRRRPMFVTADAALQAFRDEFQSVLQKAERDAAERLAEMSQALMKAYAARLEGSQSADDRYYAVLFASAWVPLAAMQRVKQPTFDDHMEAAFGDGGGDDYRALMKPPLERLPAQLPAVLEQVPSAIRPRVKELVTAMLKHEGAGTLPVPGRDKPYRVDWTQFRPRGAYADSELAAYFLAMSWFANTPLPFSASLPDFLDIMERTPLRAGTARDAWSRVDTVVGAFMGRPVDATLEHLKTVRDEDRAAWADFARNAEKIAARLEELRGPMPLRDLEAAESGAGGARLKITLFPKRVGLDTTFFRSLVHPDVEGRGVPSSLDVMATLGSERAGAHARAAVKDEVFAAAYNQALDELVGEHARGLATTDLYHAWLAALVALTRGHGLPDDSLLRFAKTPAWRDRLLSSALAGYAELKHSAVLYNMQDMGVECDSDSPVYVLIEQPILPTPRGYVDPTPEFFDALAGLADRVYRDVHGDPEGPSVPYYGDRGGDGDGVLNARSFARDLAKIARKEVRGEALDDADVAWIHGVGGRLEALLLTMEKTKYSVAASPETRTERGVALVTDIHTNITRRQVLEVGVGRLLDLWVAVPRPVGEELTQGGLFSFYEFTHPMDERMTDAEWHEQLERGDAPPLPRWTASFVEAP